MAMTIDELKRTVFPRESGGDYDALYGFSNRPGGKFSNVKLTDMTVDQALAFANPSGVYGQWVKSTRPDKQYGIATPMGAFQIVGTTLRGAKQGMGLTGNERMTPEMQDKIATWIYNTQGPSAWSLPAGGGTGGGGRIASSSGGTPAMGLMDFQQSPEPQTFKERLQEGIKSGALWDNLALAFNSMRLNPDQGIGQIVKSRQEQRAQERTANRTAQWLMSQGREDLARALLSGAVDAKTAAAVALTPPADNRTAMIQNYEYWLSQGRSPEEAQALAKAGAGGMTLDLSGGGKFEETFAKGDADLLGNVYSTGLAAQRNISRIGDLERLLGSAPSGGLGAMKLAAGQFGINTEGLSDLQAAQAIINSLVPEQRQPGSGPMSDADLELFKQSLPRIINQPGGNATIINAMKKIALYDAEGAKIVQDLRTGAIDRGTAFRMLMERQHPLAGIQLGGGAAPAQTQAPSGLSPEDLEFLKE